MFSFLLQNLSCHSPCKSPALHTCVTRYSDGRKPCGRQPAVLQRPESFCVKSPTLFPLLVKCTVTLLRNCSLLSISSRFKHFHNCVSKNQDCRQDVAFRLQQENIQLCLCGSWCHFHFRHGYTCAAAAEAAAVVFCSVQRAALVLGSHAKPQKKQPYPIFASTTHFFRTQAAVLVHNPGESHTDSFLGFTPLQAIVFFVAASWFWFWKFSL